jgi:serine/threonine protein kinase
MPSPEPGRPGRPDPPGRSGKPGEDPRDVAQLRDLADEAVTVGADAPVDAPRSGGQQRHLVSADQRAQMATGSEPNGWFAGPHADPDRFELLGPGLAGGEGNTWRGRYRGELAAPLTLAVKELRRPARAPADWPTPADLRRWNDQRALLQYMRIDHLVTVIDIFVGAPPHLPGAARGVSPDTPYVVMEWVPGPTLADEFSGVPATADTLDQRLAHVQHVAEALHALHSQTASAGNPTLHRDVKPTNCILDPRRGVVLVDVGTMRRMDDGYDHDGLHTPAYTAPEVLADPRAARAAASDLYSLGALAYFCVVGEDPPLPDQPEAAEQVTSRLLAAARAARVADANTFVTQLRLMLDSVPHQRPSDAMSWSRRLRALGATRASGLRLGSHRARTLVGSGLITAAVLAGAFVVHQQRSNGDGPTSADTSAGTPGLSGAALPGASSSALPGGPPGAPGVPPADAPTPVGRPAADGTLHSRFATFVFPQHGRPADRCTMLRGTSSLPAGQTLITSVVNLEMRDGVRHLQLVQNWQHPTALRRWRGPQFIGLPQDPAGWRFQVEVIMVPLDPLRQQIAAAGGEAGPWRSQFPHGSRLVASISVTRGSGGDPASCPPGPPGPPGPPPGSRPIPTGSPASS